MNNIPHKLNHSFESEPSSSNESSADTTSLDKSITGRTKLVDLFCINATEKNAKTTINELIIPNEYQSKINSNRLLSNNRQKILSSSDESEFEGFLSIDLKLKSIETVKNSQNLSSNSESEFEGFLNVDLKSKSIEIAKKLENLSSKSGSDFEGFSSSNGGMKSSQTSTSSSIGKFDSVEISDQDERCRKDIKNVNLECILNDRLLEVTNFSIEPSSSNDDRIAVRRMVSISSADENSCNAVDINLFLKKEKTNLLSQNLSFDGKIDSITKSNERITLKSVNNRNNGSNLILLQSDVNRKDINEQSPDLFSDDSADENDVDSKTVTDSEDENYNFSKTETNTIDIDKCSSAAQINEKNLLKRIQLALSGVLPPPSVTVLQMDMSQMLTTYKQNKEKWLEISPTEFDVDETLFKQTHAINDVKDMQWPNALQAYAHGIMYNRSTYSENIELLCMKYAERNIGAETCSSFTFNCSPSSVKKRAIRMKMLTKSPGNRLSHLAKRRAMFSSANLLSSSQPSQSSAKLGKKVLLIDIRKSERKARNKRRTPKRYTPNKKRTPGRKTPGSEHKLIFTGLPKPTIGPIPQATRESSKRALFQSPAKEQQNQKFPIVPLEIAIRAEKSKRVLFSQYDNDDLRQYSSSFSTTINNNSKRKREDDWLIEQSTKSQKTESQLPSKTLKLAKSQSFCVGSVSTNKSSSRLGELKDQVLFRASSETSFNSSQQLSDSHRQKIFWAVSTSLKKKQIGTKHLKFKQYASTLAKVVKRLFLEMDRKSGSTQSTLLKLADNVVYWVLQDKSIDEIYMHEKLRMDRSKPIAPKLTGYIGPEEYEQRKERLQKCLTQFQSENSWDSFNISQVSLSLAQTINSQTLDYAHTQEQSSQSSFCSGLTNRSLISEIDPILSSQKLNQNEGLNSGGKLFDNSGTKTSNLNSVLRENVDSEQRQKSAQKNCFSGRDQKNVSPYSDRKRGNVLIATAGTSQLKQNSMLSMKNANILKAKRQISFDV